MADKYINPSGLQTIKEWVEGKIPTATSDLTNDSGFATETYVNTAVSGKQNTLTAGDNIDITNDTISVDGVVPAAEITNGIPYGIVDGTSTSTAFTATVDGVTELVDGTCVMLKNGVVTSAAGFTINVNNLGAKPVYSSMSAATAESTLFNINYTMLFVYDSTRVTGGAWILYRGYNSDTTVGRGVIDYYYRPYAGQTIYRYKLCMQGADNRLYPVTITNQTKATQVAKKPTTIPLRASAGVWYYNSTTTVDAGTAVGAQLLYPSYYLTTCAYNFNTATGTYKNAYLRGSYDKATDLFTLYDDGSATPTSYYAFAPCNTANITLSDYFVSGYYYILLGGTYSTTNYLSLFDNNPIYYFDGTNLIPVSTKVAQDIANTAVAGKQDTLTFDSSPTANSSNPVTSGGIYTAIQNAISSGTDIYWGTYGTTTYSQITTALSNNQLPVIEKDDAYYIYVGINEGVYYFSLNIAMSIGFGLSSGVVSSCVLDNNNEWGTIAVGIPNEDDIQTEINGIVANYLPLSGGTLTGSLTLNGAPTSNLEAATKKYVDDNTTNKQGTITANGILKGNGSGTITAAVAGTDYQAPLTFDNSPTANSNNPVKSGGVYTAIQDAVKTYDVEYEGQNNPTLKKMIEDYLSDGKIPVVNSYGGMVKIDQCSLMLDIDAGQDDLGFYGIDWVLVSKAWNSGGGNTYGIMHVRLTNETLLGINNVPYDSTQDTWSGDSNSFPNKDYVDNHITSAVSNKQDSITANGILKGDGSGNISAATAGTDYQTPLPSQSGNSGKFLTTNGSAMSWGSVPTPPSAYTSNPEMDGTASAGSSANYAKGDHVHPTDTSRQAKITASGILKGDGNGGVSAAVSGTDYQAPLTFDSTPTQNSSNPVTSGGIYTAINNAKEIFWCTPNVTTFAEITTALANNKYPVVKMIDEEDSGLTIECAFTLSLGTAYEFTGIGTLMGTNYILLWTIDQEEGWNLQPIDITFDTSDYLELSGGQMTGELQLREADSYYDDEAVPKKYIQTISANIDFNNVSAPVTWEQCVKPSSDARYGAYCTANHCWYCILPTSGSETIYKSKDAVTWEIISTGLSGWLPSQYVAYADNMIAICGKDGRIAVSFDGETWSNPLTSVEEDAVSIYAMKTNSKYYIYMDNTLYVSNNQTTFSAVTLPSLPSDNFVLISMVGNQKTGCLFYYHPMQSNYAQVIYTTDGSTWALQALSYNYAPKPVATADYIVYLVTDNQGNVHIYRSKNGSYWAGFSMDDAVTLGSVVSDGARIIAYSSNSNGARISYDNGVKWHSISMPFNNSNYAANRMVCGGEGQFLIGNNNTSNLYKSAVPNSYPRLLPWLNKLREDIEDDVSKMTGDIETALSTINTALGGMV